MFGPPGGAGKTRAARDPIPFARDLLYKEVKWPCAARDGHFGAKQMGLQIDKLGVGEAGLTASAPGDTGGSLEGIKRGNDECSFPEQEDGGEVISQVCVNQGNKPGGDGARSEAAGERVP